MELTFELFFFCYIYVIKALTLWQFCTYVFPSRLPKLLSFVLSFALYYPLFHISYSSWSRPNLLLFFLITFVYIISFFKTKWHTALGIATLCTIFSIATKFISIALSCTQIFEILTLHQINIFSVLSQFLYYSALTVVSFFIHKEISRRTQIAFFVIFGIFLISTWLFLIANYLLERLHSNMTSVGLFLLLVGYIVVFSFFQHNEQLHSEMTKAQVHSQREYDAIEYYKMLIQQHENQSILIHDIRKHLNSISLLNEEGDPQKVASYINQIITSPALQKKTHFCDNQMFNMILSRYARDCQEQGIQFHPDIRSNSLGFVSDEDLTALFCNLLDNSVEAAVKQEDSYIDLSVIPREGTPFTLITVINSCRTNPFSPETGQLVTHKKDASRHGYGIKSINRIVAKYNGEIQMYYDKETLTFHTIIALKNQDRL